MSETKKCKLAQPWVWDFRVSAEGEHGWDFDKVKEFCKAWGKKWVFQLEKSPKKENGTGDYLHWQGRISLIKKITVAGAKKTIRPLPMYFEPTVIKEHLKEAFYCVKFATRIEGPWKDDDVEKPPMTKQLTEFLKFELRPYQQHIKCECDKWDDRRIDIIYDSLGNCGKSLLSEWLEYEGIAEEVPPYRSMEDIMGWVCTRPIKKVYIFDMPRGMKKDKLADFYAGIECIKNGIAYDKRYSAKKIRFDRPRVFVFTNSTPVFELLSKDRWVIWDMKPGYNVDLYSAEEWQAFQANPNFINDGFLKAADKLNC